MTQNTAVSEDTEETTVRTRGGKALDKYGQRRIRTGKTRKDHENGSHRARLSNLADRGAWINETRGKAYSSESAVPRMPKPHGKGNSAKAFKIKAAKAARG